MVMVNIKNSNLNIRNCISGFNCGADWETMRMERFDPDTESKIKFCYSCQKEVFECKDDDELIKNIRLNRCVYVYYTESNERPLMGDFIIDPKFK